MLAPKRATYTIKELEALLGLSRSAVYLAIKSGELPSFKIGRRVLIPKQAIDAMLTGKIAPAPVKPAVRKRKR